MNPLKSTKIHKQERNKIKKEHGLETEKNVPQLLLIISFILIVLVPVLTAMAPKAKADGLHGDVLTQVESHLELK